MLRGYTPQAALDSPRFCISSGNLDSQTKDTGTAGDMNSEVYIEEGIPLETIEKLRQVQQWVIFDLQAHPIQKWVTMLVKQPDSNAR
jgi:hypothetical protein